MRPALLPPLLVVADGSATAGRPLLTVIEAAVEGGARAVWLRDRQRPAPERREAANRLATLLHDAGGVLVASPGPGDEVADGIQLGSADPAAPGDARPAGRSCHDPAQLARAAAEGCAWATLSPMFPSASKPGYGPARSLDELRDAPLPVWALGGIDAGNAPTCLWAGAAGVAVMGAVLAARDPAAAVGRLLDAVGAVAR